MNKWQMEKSAKKSGSGWMEDNTGRIHRSIHPSGRRRRNQTAQRKRREERRIAETMGAAHRKSRGGK